MQLTPIAAAALVLACSKPADKPAAQSETPSASAEKDAAAPAKNNKPRGWEAYENRKGQDAGAMEAAIDGTVVGSDGKPLKLSELWAEHNVALVFYRGHW